MRLPMPPIPMKPTVSFIAAPSSRGARVGQAFQPDEYWCASCQAGKPDLLAGARVRRPQPRRVVGRAVEPVGGLETLEPALRSRPRGPRQQRRDLLLRERPKR